MTHKSRHDAVVHDDSCYSSKSYRQLLAHLVYYSSINKSLIDETEHNIPVISCICVSFFNFFCTLTTHKHTHTRPHIHTASLNHHNLQHYEDATPRRQKSNRKLSSSALLSNTQEVNLTYVPYFIAFSYGYNITPNV